MSTRVVIRGRTAWASPGFYREERERKTWARVHRAEKQLAQDLEDHPPEPVVRSPPQPGVPILDADGVTYRHVKRLDPAEGWVTAGVVMQWYGVPHARVLEWVHRGMLDAAVEAGGAVKRYRVLDPARCAAEGAAPPEPKKKRGKRA